MRALSLGPVLCLVIAGCAGSEAVTQSTPAAPNVVSGEAAPDAGSIAGVIVDDAQAPIAGATVALADTPFQVATDEGGAFAFLNLAPATYHLQVASLGFQSVVRVVELAPNAEEQLIIVLTRLAIVEPYYDTFGPFSGYFECRLGTPGIITPCTGDTVHDQDLNGVVFPNDKTQLHYNLTSDDWATMVGEARWSQGSFATSTGMAVYPSYLKRASSHWWCEADGRSPIQFHYHHDGDSECNSQGQTNPEPSPDINPLVLVADPGFGGTSAENTPVRAMLQQRFELLMTVFYFEPAPEGYSGFGDG